MIVDGIVAGEGEGPLSPTPKHCGLVFASQNPVALDAVAARFMGYDYQKIPLIREAINLRRYPLAQFDVEDIVIQSNEKNWSGNHLRDLRVNFAFKPSQGWQGHIEITPPKSSIPQSTSPLGGR